MTESIEVNLPDIEISGGIDTGGVCFEDRNFVENALVDAGAEITDGGFGCGGADLGYRKDGIQFSLTIRRRIKLD